MVILQSCKPCFASTIGEHGLRDDSVAAIVQAAAPALEKLRSAFADNSLPHLTLPSQNTDIEPIQNLAADLCVRFSDIILCGTGGSSLGGQALAQIAGWNAPVSSPGLGDMPRLHFADNLDAHSYAKLLDALELESAHFIIVSKSGGTAETLSQTMAAIQALENAGLREGLARHFTGLSEPAMDGRANALRSLLEGRGVSMLDHLTDLGGRFSALSNVGLLPAAIAGLDIAQVRVGAKSVVDNLLNCATPADCPPVLGAAINIAAMRKGANISVLMAYCDRLERFTKWYVQLWAESLGKNGKGSTPLGALGPVDQHSQLQLFLDGPRDKLFTIITTNTRGTGTTFSAELAAEASADYLAGKSMGDLVDSMQRATVDTLARNGRPVRTLHIDSVDGEAIGALMMHFMLETIIAAHIMEIDPFDQPAVEQGKVLARQYLADQ